MRSFLACTALALLGFLTNCQGRVLPPEEQAEPVLLQVAGSKGTLAVPASCSTFGRLHMQACEHKSTTTKF
eukprot:847493-Pelagomonas_calceolata.AAC.6